MGFPKRRFGHWARKFTDDSQKHRSRIWVSRKNSDRGAVSIGQATNRLPDLVICELGVNLCSWPFGLKNGVPRWPAKLFTCFVR